MTGREEAGAEREVMGCSEMLCLWLWQTHTHTDLTHRLEEAGAEREVMDVMFVALADTHTHTHRLERIMT